MSSMDANPPQQPVKSTTGLQDIVEKRPNDEDVDIEAHPDAFELQPIKTVRSHASHRSSVIERGYSHAQSDMARDIVGWDGEEDPENPRNWQTKRKVLVMAWIAAICFVRYGFFSRERIWN